MPGLVPPGLAPPGLDEGAGAATRYSTSTRLSFAKGTVTSEPSFLRSLTQSAVFSISDAWIRTLPLTSLQKRTSSVCPAALLTIARSTSVNATQLRTFDAVFMDPASALDRQFGRHNLYNCRE